MHKRQSVNSHRYKLKLYWTQHTLLYFSDWIVFKGISHISKFKNCDHI